MLSPSQKTRLQHQHESVVEITKGLSEEQLRVRPDTGKWSPFENIAHLAAYQPSFIDRLKRIEKEDAPLFERYVAEKDSRFFECCEMELHQLNEFLFTHRFLISNHISALPETSLSRIGRHPLYGDLTIPKWTEFFLLHEAHHLFTIFKLLNSTAR
jgi:hypothetical protein